MAPGENEFTPLQRNKAGLRTLFLLTPEARAQVTNYYIIAISQILTFRVKRQPSSQGLGTSWECTQLTGFRQLGEIKLQTKPLTRLT